MKSFPRHSDIENQSLSPIIKFGVDRLNFRTILDGNRVPFGTEGSSPKILLLGMSRSFSVPNLKESNDPAVVKRNP